MPEAFFQVDLLTPNQSEARAILGLNFDQSDDATIAKRLLDRGAKCVVLKLGSGGAMVMDRSGNASLIELFAVTAVDTTAAGDAFTAAMAVPVKPAE
jgi:ribokinase